MWPDGACAHAVLARQPEHVPAVRFLNFEGQPEAVDLVNRWAHVGPHALHPEVMDP